jgi:hypothetical protein
MSALRLPDGSLHQLTPPRDWPAGQPPARSRRAYAALHVVATPDGQGVDWDETLELRHRTWALGLGVAEAMDTAQRGMGLTWPLAAELIRRSAAERGGALVAGVGTDQLHPASVQGPAEVLAAYREQLAVVEECGATAVLMASRALAVVARDADDYLRVYGNLLAEVTRPVILHWLGPMFDPALTGYWGSTDLDVATSTLLTLIHAHAERVHGIKVSLLDRHREIALRAALPPGVRLYTGDDYHYPELILGDGEHHSDALLGILGGIARPAAAALARLDDGDADGFFDILAPTVPLARHIFTAPTYHYKTGLAFLAWLNGEQSRFRLLDGLDRARDAAHLARLVQLADQAGVLVDPDLAAARAGAYFGAA